MQPYKSRSGKKSGVEEYEIGADYIIVKFEMYKSPYKYSYSSAGKEAVEKMKKLAIQSKGLSTYISRKKPVFED